VDIAQSQRSGDWAQAITAVKANGDIKPAALVEHRRKGRPGVVDGAPAAEAGRPGASSEPQTYWQAARSGRQARTKARRGTLI